MARDLWCVRVDLMMWIAAAAVVELASWEAEIRADERRRVRAGLLSRLDRVASCNLGPERNPLPVLERMGVYRAAHEATQ